MNNKKAHSWFCPQLQKKKKKKERKKRKEKRKEEIAFIFNGVKFYLIKSSKCHIIYFIVSMCFCTTALLYQATFTE